MYVERDLIHAMGAYPLTTALGWAKDSRLVKDLRFTEKEEAPLEIPYLPRTSIFFTRSSRSYRIP